MRKLIKILAKLLDYVLFYLVVVFFLDLFDADLYLYIVGLALTPLFFIPIEAVFLKFFRTTLGKMFFGLRYEAPFTWKTALTSAWHSENLVQKRPKIIPSILIMLTAIALSVFCIAPDTATRFIGGKENTSLVGGSLSIPTENWIKVTADNRHFSALFPKEPTLSEQYIQSYQYKEYIHTDELTYTLGYVDLPRKYTKWGSKRVFQGIYKLVARDYVVKYRSISQHGSFPAYEYSMSDRENKKHIGKLVLVGNTLYRINVAKDTPFTPEDNSLAKAFFTSFRPTH